MSQASRNHRVIYAFLRSKSEADARALDEGGHHALERELWMIHAGKRANKQSGKGAWLVRAQRAVA